MRSATSSALAGRPPGYFSRNSCHRLSSPYQSSARRLLILTMRSVSTGPGLTPTTRTPKSRLWPPSARVNAISAAFAVLPAM